jgi:multiple sugar transport system permease protein
VRYTALILGAILFLIPFYLLLRNALMSERDLGSPQWYWVPPSWHPENFTAIFNDPALPMARSLFNSVAIAIVQTLGVLALSGLAGYGLARIPYRWSNAVFYLITATLLIPAAVTFVPSFVLVSTLGWISTLRGLIIPGLFQALATFLFRQFFLGFPKEIEERPSSTGSATGGPSGGSSCRTPTASPPRSGRSPSSAPGTPSSGHWSSAASRRPGRFRSPCRPS